MNLLSRTLEFGPTAKGSFRFSTGAQGGNRNCQVKTRMGRWAFAARNGYLISALQTGHDAMIRRTVKPIFQNAIATYLLGGPLCAVARLPPNLAS